MAFVQVDPSQLQMDAPGQGAPQGFVSVDPTKLQMDAPKMNLIEQIGASPVSNAVGNVIDQTGDILKNIPNQNPASSGLQIVGQGAKMLGTIPGQAIASASAPIVAPAQSIANTIDSTGAGKYVGNKLMQAKDLYDQFTQAHPEISGDIGAGLNIVGTLQGGQAATNAIDSLKPPILNAVNKLENASQKLPGFLGDVSSGVEKPTTFSPEALETGAKLHYADAEQAGAMLKPQGFANTVYAIKQKVGPQDAVDVEFAGENPVTKTLSKLDNIVNSGNSVTLQNLDNMDTRLHSDISVAMRAGDNKTASDLMNIKSMLKNSSETANPQDLVNPDAFDSWRQGDTLWTAKTKMQQLQGIVDNAYNTDNPDTAMRTGYKNLAKQIAKNPQGWTPQEISMIQSGAQRGIAAGALKILGSRLMSGIIGTAAGATTGPIGAVVGGLTGEAVGYPMRAAANAMQESRAMAPFTAVANRPGVIAAMPQSVADIAKLPMAQQKAAFDALLRGATIKP